MAAVVGLWQRLEEGGEFEDFDVGRAGGPVVAPADDDVAASGGVAVIAEIAAFKFEFDVDALPALGSDLAFGFAVGEAGLDGFDDVAQLFGDHAEEKDDALFVDWFVTEATEVHGLAIAGAAVQRRMAKFGGRELRGRLRARPAIVVGEGRNRGSLRGFALHGILRSAQEDRICERVAYGLRGRRREILRAKTALRMTRFCSRLRMTALCFFAFDRDEVIVPLDRSGLGCGEKSYDIGPFGGPFGFALRECTEDIGKAGPGAETAFQGAMVEFSEVTVRAARGRLAIFTNRGCPIFEKFAVFEAFVQGVRLESGGFNGVIPGWEESRDLMFGDSGERDEFGARRRTASAASDGGQATEDERFVDTLAHRVLRYLLMIVDRCMITQRTGALRSE